MEDKEGKAGKEVKEGKEGKCGLGIFRSLRDWNIKLIDSGIYLMYLSHNRKLLMIMIRLSKR